MKKKVFKTAWTLFKKFQDRYQTFGEALKAAWAKIKLESALNNGSQSFTFLKKNGEIRTAIGESLSEKNYTIKHTGRKKPASIVTYFDLDKNAVRSFNIWQLV